VLIRALLRKLKEEGAEAVAEEAEEEESPTKSARVKVGLFYSWGNACGIYAFIQL